MSLKLKPELLSRFVTSKDRDSASPSSGQADKKASEAAVPSQGRGSSVTATENAALEASQDDGEKAVSPPDASGIGNSDSSATAAPTAASGDTPAVSPPPSLIKSALKPGAKRSATTDGAGKPKGKATPRKKVKL